MPKLLSDRLRSAEAGGAMAEILAELATHRRLGKTEIAAGAMFLRDLAAHHGSSGGLVGSVTERVDTSLNVRAGASWTRSHERCQRALDHLHDHERRILDWMICHREKARPDLATLGRMVSTYSNRDHAIASAVASISGVLRSIAEIYMPEQATDAA